MCFLIFSCSSFLNVNALKQHTTPRKTPEALNTDDQCFLYAQLLVTNHRSLSLSCAPHLLRLPELSLHILLLHQHNCRLCVQVVTPSGSPGNTWLILIAWEQNTQKPSKESRPQSGSCGFLYWKCKSPVEGLRTKNSFPFFTL